MPAERAFRLVADVSSEALERVGSVLENRFGSGVTRTSEGFHVVGDVNGESARDLNRELLSSLRHEEKRTRLRAEWTASGITERFFDYVPKGSRPAT